MLEQSWKKVYSRTTTKSVPLIQPEHGCCHQNVPERGQLRDWYPDEKMMVLLVCLNGRCCTQGAWVLYRINKDEDDESLLFLVFRRHIVNAVFLKYSAEGRLSSSHVGIRNTLSGVCYDDAKHYHVQSEHRRTQNLFKHLR